MKRSALVAIVLLTAVLGLHGFATASFPELAPTQTVTAVRTTTTFSVTPSANGTPTTTITATPTRRVTTTATLTATLTPIVTATITATPEISVTNTPTATPTRTTPTPTPIRYPLSLDPNVLSIDALRSRPYGGSGIKITRVVSTGEAYKQVLIEYPSDGLKITGAVNIPRGLGPFPVVVLDHGYFSPAEYKPGDGTNRAADSFAQHGYLTIAPDYRCYGGSQCGSNPFDIGYAIDVLNLIAQLPSLPDADPERVGIWGHSMGGGITLRVLAVNDSIKVASLYGALTGDDEVHYCWLRGCRAPAAPTREPRYAAGLQEMDPDFLLTVPIPAASADVSTPYHEIFLKSSPSRHLANVSAAVIIHHGESDDTVPMQWSIDLANALSAEGKLVSLYTYPGEGHVFAGWGWQLFMTRTLSFFDEYLNPRETPITVERRVLRQERIAAELSY